MRTRVALVLILVAAGATGLAGCSTSSKFGGDVPTASADSAASSDSAAADTNASPETTGSIVTQPAEPGPSGEPVAPMSKPGLLGDDPNDDLQLGKKYFRANNFGLAEKSFQTAVEKHPNDAESWVCLAASYDRLRRFDLADRAYAQAVRLIGPTVEILNDEGFSYMLRGDYARAHKILEEAKAKDPGNPYVQANLQLLDDSASGRKAVQ
jgi:tetratricopeptide (TPR) repeat protein/predicted small secreted protein